MKKFVMILLCACIAAIPLSAQMREEMKGRNGRPMERLDRYKKLRMVETLNLEEETGIKLVSRYTKHRERMKELENDRGSLVDKLEELTKTNTGDAEYQKVFSEFGSLEMKISEARKKYLDELKDILTNKQIAEYLVFERDFMKDVRNVAKEVQKERQQK